MSGLLWTLVGIWLVGSAIIAAVYATIATIWLKEDGMELTIIDMLALFLVSLTWPLWLPIKVAVSFWR